MGAGDVGYGKMKTLYMEKLHSFYTWHSTTGESQ